MLAAEVSGHVASSIGGGGKRLSDLGTSPTRSSGLGEVSNYEKQTSMMVSVGDKQDIPVAGSGDVVLLMKSFERPRKVTLHNMLHVLGFGMNLISLRMLQGEGATYWSTPKGLTVLMEGEELLSAKLEGLLYHVNAQLGQEEAYAAGGAGLQLWHCRMGHLHY